MSCSPDIAAQFPNVDVLLFTSTIQATSPMDYSGATNTIVAAFTEMEKLAQSASAMPTQAMIENPYTTLLRPRMRNDRVYNLPKTEDKKIFVESITFTVYDGRVNGSALVEPVSGKLYQDADLNTAVETSQSNPTDKYLTSPYRNAMVGNWQPNYFRPFIKINGETILDARQSFYSPYDNLGDIAYGYDFPFCIEPQSQIRYIDDIVIAACAFQYVDNTSPDLRVLYRFPVHCEIKVRYK